MDSDMTNSQWMRPDEEVVHVGKIGQGGYGEVHKVHLS
jgi:hypothetical protein